MPQPTSRRALIVDDLSMHRTVISSALTMEDFESDAVEDGVQGLRKLKDHRYDVIFLDIQMPNMNGLEFLARVQRDPEAVATPVIMLSTLDDPKTLEQAQRLGASDYLTKPYTTEAIRAALDGVGLR